MSEEHTLPSGAAFLWEPTGSRELMSAERFTDEQRQMAKAARDFSEKDIPPRVKEIESKRVGLLPALLRKAGELGLLMGDVPPEYGGLGLDMTTSMLVAEQFSHVGSFSVSHGAHTGIGTMPIVYFGTSAQKAAYLPDLATGKRLAAYALTEASSGSDALAAKTRAMLSTDGKYWILKVARDMLTAYAPRAYGFVVHTGRHVLMDICEGASLAGHLEAIDKLRTDWPTKVITAKRRLAAAVLGADGYPLV